MSFAKQYARENLSLCSIKGFEAGKPFSWLHISEKLNPSVSQVMAVKPLKNLSFSFKWDFFFKNQNHMLGIILTCSVGRTIWEGD